MTLEDKENYTQTVLNDYFQLKSLTETIQKYDSKESYIMKEFEEIKKISNDLNKIIN